MARVAFILPNLRGGGAERVALTLIQSFVDDGHAVDLVLADAAGEFLAEVPPQARVIDLKAGSMRAALGPLISYFREHRPDAAQVSMWPLTAIATAARLLARVRTRIVVSDHTILSRQYASGSARRLLKWTTRLLYPRADARVCVSEACAQDLAQLSRLPRSAFTVIGNPIVLKSTTNEAKERVEQLWPAAEKRILTVGSLKPVKNHALLLRAMVRVNEKIDAALMIVGKGMLVEQTRELAVGLGLADKVAIPGFQSDVAALYDSAHLFVLSSDHEGFGNVLVEALLSGLPVVSTDCPGEPRNILDGGRFGPLVPLNDEEALAGAILAALNEPVDRAALISRGRVLAGADSWRAYRALLLPDLSKS